MTAIDATSAAFDMRLTLAVYFAEKAPFDNLRGLLVLPFVIPITTIGCIVSKKLIKICSATGCSCGAWQGRRGCAVQISFISLKIIDYSDWEWPTRKLRQA